MKLNIIFKVWGLPYMTSAKFSDFMTPSPPCHCHKSADLVPFVCFGTPYDHLTTVNN